MPIAPERSPEVDEAGSAWLLFGETAKVLRKGGNRSERDRLLQNVYRGLQSYEPKPGAVRGFHGLHRTTHEAVDEAFERTAPGVPREAAVETLIARMRAVVTNDGGAPDDIERIAGFCERVRENLDRHVRLP